MLIVLIKFAANHSIYLHLDTFHDNIALLCNWTGNMKAVAPSLNHEVSSQPVSVATSRGHQMARKIKKGFLLCVVICCLLVLSLILKEDLFKRSLLLQYVGEEVYNVRGPEVVPGFFKNVSCHQHCQSRTIVLILIMIIRESD